MGIETMTTGTATTDATPLLAVPLIQKTISTQPVLAVTAPVVAKPVSRLALGAAQGLTTCGPQARREASPHR